MYLIILNKYSHSIVSNVNDTRGKKYANIVKVDGKTGFIGCGVIRSKNGKAFYSSKVRVTKFNLPKGEYIFDGKFKQLETPVHYKLKRIPKDEKNYFNLDKDYEIILSDLPCAGMCHLYKDETPDKIFLDNSLLELPTFCIEFVKEHELAHRRFRTESYCDAVAYNKLIDKGYNPCQLLTVADLTLKGNKRRSYIWKMSKNS